MHCSLRLTIQVLQLLSTFRVGKLVHVPWADDAMLMHLPLLQLWPSLQPRNVAASGAGGVSPALSPSHSCLSLATASPWASPSTSPSRVRPPLARAATASQFRRDVPRQLSSAFPLADAGMRRQTVHPAGRIQPGRKS